VECLGRLEYLVDVDLCVIRLRIVASANTSILSVCLFSVLYKLRYSCHQKRSLSERVS